MKKYFVAVPFISALSFILGCSSANFDQTGPGNLPDDSGSDSVTDSAETSSDDSGSVTSTGAMPDSMAASDSMHHPDSVVFDSGMVGETGADSGMVTKPADSGMDVATPDSSYTFPPPLSGLMCNYSSRLCDPNAGEFCRNDPADMPVGTDKGYGYCGTSADTRNSMIGAPELGYIHCYDSSHCAHSGLSNPVCCLSVKGNSDGTYCSVTTSQIVNSKCVAASPGLDPCGSGRFQPKPTPGALTNVCGGPQEHLGCNDNSTCPFGQSCCSWDLTVKFCVPNDDVPTMPGMKCSSI